MDLFLKKYPHMRRAFKEGVSVSRRMKVERLAREKDGKERRYKKRTPWHD